MRAAALPQLRRARHGEPGFGLVPWSQPRVAGNKPHKQVRGGLAVYWLIGCVASEAGVAEQAGTASSLVMAPYRVPLVWVDRELG